MASASSSKCLDACSCIAYATLEAQLLLPKLRGLRVIGQVEGNLNLANDAERLGNYVLGTMVDFTNPTEFTIVWDTGVKEVCSTETSTIYVWESGPACLHEHLLCSACHLEFNGTRYKCRDCSGHDKYLCNACYHQDQHAVDHVFTRVVRPGGKMEIMNARKGRQKQTISGLLPESRVRRRSEDWKWENMDGGSGNLGSVLSVENDELDPDDPTDGWSRSDYSWVKVAWDGKSDNDNYHRVGKEGKCDVKLHSAGHVGKLSAYLEDLPKLNLLDFGTFEKKPFAVQWKVNDAVILDRDPAIVPHYNTFQSKLREVTEVDDLAKYKQEAALVRACEGTTVTILMVRSNVLLKVHEQLLVSFTGKLAPVSNKQATTLFKEKKTQTGLSLSDVQGALAKVGISKPSSNPTPRSTDVPAQAIVDPNELLDERAFMPKMIGCRVAFDSSESLDLRKGLLGTVVALVNDSGVDVLWDNGIESRCLFASSKLRIVDSGVCGIQHDNSCNVCQCPRIYGTLYKCAECPDYDLCTSCYHSKKHKLSHRTYRLTRPAGLAVLVEPRCFATTELCRGISVNATVARGRDWSGPSTEVGLVSDPGVVLGFCDRLPHAARSLVEVKWPNGQQSKHRLGDSGKVDLEAVNVADTLPMYVKHLPMLLPAELRLWEPHSIKLQPKDQVMVVTSSAKLRQLHPRMNQEELRECLVSVGTVIAIQPSQAGEFAKVKLSTGLEVLLSTACLGVVLEDNNEDEDEALRAALQLSLVNTEDSVVALDDVGDDDNDEDLDIEPYDEDAELQRAIQLSLAESQSNETEDTS